MDTASPVIIIQSNIDELPVLATAPEGACVLDVIAPGTQRAIRWLATLADGTQIRSQWRNDVEGYMPGKRWSEVYFTRQALDEWGASPVNGEIVECAGIVETRPAMHELYGGKIRTVG